MKHQTFGARSRPDFKARAHAFRLGRIFCGARAALAFSLLMVAGGRSESVSLAPPPQGTLYHGVYPGQDTGSEDNFTNADLQSYEQMTGRRVAWVYLSNEWARNRQFPTAMATWIRQTGAVPFIRLMLRSNDREYHREREFTLQAIIDGKFDADFTSWAEGAVTFGSPVIVEYGVEVNGDWFSWNGRWNGAAKTDGFGDSKKADGPERFVAAYRHIVEVMRQAGARNITWVFHVDLNGSPEAAWNNFENYYPGADVVDWVGFSGYGLQTPTEKEVPTSFREQLDAAYPRLVAMADGKPIVVCEFGATAGRPGQPPDQWAGEALKDLLTRRWPAVVGFSWWNEGWENDDNPAHNSTMRLQDNPALRETFVRQFQQHADRIQDRPVFTPALDQK